MPFRVAGKTFRTKKDVTVAATQILDSVPLGEEVTGEARDFILKLLLSHEDSADKVRGGVTRLSTTRDEFDTVAFQVTRTDGTVDDFSVEDCVEGLRKS